ncbi:MAG TPA: ATP-binding protein, partial [Campylobacterales bacterium]|nr:ATP-binding protein [Campylobacterales bacterium]
DEPDIALHPEWQKRMINYIINFFNLIRDKNIHLIFTTHSPFLLSDIPKQNIIFLDKNEDGTCKVVNELKEKKETFGANIHTLLSDSFFMENGLTGEFAKGKIDEVIQYLNGKEDTKIKNDDEAQKLVNIIGEPIVKNQLQRMLDSKRLKKIDEIDAIKKSMAEMQKRLDELEK